MQKSFKNEAILNPRNKLTVEEQKKFDKLYRTYLYFSEDCYVSIFLIKCRLGLGLRKMLRRYGFFSLFKNKYVCWFFFLFILVNKPDLKKGLYCLPSMEMNVIDSASSSYASQQSSTFLSKIYNIKNIFKKSRFYAQYICIRGNNHFLNL